MMRSTTQGRRTRAAARGFPFCPSHLSLAPPSPASPGSGLLTAPTYTKQRHRPTPKPSSLHPTSTPAHPSSRRPQMGQVTSLGMRRSKQSIKLRWLGCSISSSSMISISRKLKRSGSGCVTIRVSRNLSIPTAMAVHTTGTCHRLMGMHKRT